MQRLLKRRGGFTLIELMVVLVVIALLVSILMPAFAKVRERAQKARARGEADSIKSAIKAYFLEYGEWPGVPNDPDVDVYVVSNRNWDVVQHLRVRDPENPKRTLFLGFETFHRKGDALMDPWGNPYIIKIDVYYPPGTNIAAGVSVDYTVN